MMRLAALLLVFAALSHAQDPAKLAARVSAERLEKDVRKLAGFGTRHTASTTDDDARGIGAARRWLKAELKRIAAGSDGRLKVETQSFRSAGTRRLAEGVELVNVYARLAGSEPVAARRVYVVSGHYDSRNSRGSDVEGDAPGANDDASGVAVVLELARLFATHPSEATIVFLCVPGEEQGLFGARHFARQAREQKLHVAGMFTNDIVGNTLGPENKRFRDYVRVFSEGTPSAPENPMAARLRRTLGAESDSQSRQLARYIREQAAGTLKDIRVKLVFRPDRFLRGGDHMPFNEVGYAAVRFTEPYEDYKRQHQDVKEGFGDLPDFVDYEYLARVARVNAVALAALANAPSPPGRARILPRLGLTTRLSWEASPEPDVAHYEVVWRDTTAADWEHGKKVEGTEVELPLSKDDWHFGVRAVDESGLKSPVRYAMPGRSRRRPPRQPDDGK